MKTKFHKQTHKDKKGMALIVVVMVFLVFTTLSTGFIYTSTNNVKTSVDTQEYNEVYYDAEAGINIMVELIQGEAEKLYNEKVENDVFKDALNSRVLSALSTSSVTYNSGGYYDINLGDIQSKVTVSEEPITGENATEYLRVIYDIRSEGHHDGKSRTLSTQLGVQYFLPKPEEDEGNSFMLDVALLSFGTISSSGSFNVIGAPAASLSDAVPAINWGPDSNIPNLQIVNPGECADIEKRVKAKNACSHTSAYEGDNFTPNIVMPDLPIEGFNEMTPEQRKAFYLPNDDNFVKNGNFEKKNPVDTYKFPIKDPTSDTVVYYVPNFTINQYWSSNTLNLDVGDKDVKIVTDNLAPRENNVSFKVLGSGSLTFYVLDNFSIGGGSGTFGNPENTLKTIVYAYKPGLNLSISGSKKAHMSIMAIDMDLSVSGSGDFNGNIITGGSKVDVSGGSSNEAQLVYAPYATVTMSGSGSLRGAVVAHNFKGSGGGNIVYDARAFTDLPFDITSPIITEEPGGGSGGGTESSEGVIFIINQAPIVEE